MQFRNCVGKIRNCVITNQFQNCAATFVHFEIAQDLQAQQLLKSVVKQSKDSAVFAIKYCQLQHFVVCPLKCLCYVCKCAFVKALSFPSALSL